MRIKIGGAILLASSLPTVNLTARQPEHARHAMVVTQEPLAADVGLRVLQAGGNAMDAAVASETIVPLRTNKPASGRGQAYSS